MSRCDINFKFRGSFTQRLQYHKLHSVGLRKTKKSPSQDGRVQPEFQQGNLRTRVDSVT
jgi:hypothetical protein